MKEQLPGAFVRKLVDMANAVGAGLDETDPRASVEVVAKIVGAADVVFGVWQDDDEPNGVGLHCIKGIERIAEIAHSGHAGELKLAAVPCTSVEQAIAAERRFGNPKH
jgi:hypothetical protein